MSMLRCMSGGVQRADHGPPANARHRHCPLAHRPVRAFRKLHSNQSARFSSPRAVHHSSLHADSRSILTGSPVAGRQSFQLCRASSASRSPVGEPDDARGVAGHTERSGPLASIQASAALFWQQIEKLEGSWNKFIPMVLLFFCMSFVNTLVDSLKDTLVITAVGGGTEVLPYITVYAVLPMSFLFLVVFSFATQRYSRARLFNIIICSFLAFFIAFAWLFPHHQALHLHIFADTLTTWMPSGFSGGIGMIRNWMFTAFYVSSELWGDVVLSLLFWGLANETTALHEAPVLYPLFGVGANIGQAAAGKLLRVFTTRSAGRLSFSGQLQVTMGVVLTFGAAILAIHAYMVRRFPQQRVPSEVVARAQRLAQRKRALEAKGLSGADAAPSSADASLDERFQVREGSSSTAAANGSEGTSVGLRESEDDGSSEPAAAEKKKLSLREAFAFLAASKQVRCLALMALAQGISTNLLEVAWKNHLHMLHPSPAAYAAYMGDVAMWTGIVTGSLMLCSPVMFEKMGWRGVAGATPRFMLLTGAPFFVGCLAYNFSPLATGAAAIPLLRALVLCGALLQVVGKGCKFSMFKPAEEMVYIGLDDESRTKGKAAIDVVGAQSGKSLGSVLQQGLLIATGGMMARTLPVMGIAFFIMVQQWSSSVHDLADYQESVSYVAEHPGEESDDEVIEQLLPPSDENASRQGSPGAAPA